MKIKLFYSYCHSDTKYREEIEKTLFLLRREGLLDEWNDRMIVPGTSISKKIKEHLLTSNIYIFLLSRNFLNSEPCIKEWEEVKEVLRKRTIYRVPIILKSCPWEDFLRNDDVKALPDDGKPIEEYDSPEKAYKQIYNGIKEIIEEYRSFHEPKKEFLQEIIKSDFISQEQMNLDDIFIFPELEEIQVKDEELYLRIKDEESIFSKKYALIHGENDSGKTALGNYLFLYKTKKKLPVLLVDLEAISNKKPGEAVFKRIYEEQFSGDYEIWKEQKESITIIFDNLLNAKNSIGHVELAKSFSQCIIILVTSNEFQAYFRDETRLADFTVIAIRELSRVKLHDMIKRRLESMDNKKNFSYEKIDHFERKVLQILKNGIVPVYPFFVLSILQTFEGYMPENMEISSYSHCYKVLITAHLIKSGVDKTDSELNSYFNFLERYAFHIFKNDKDSFEQFKDQYSQDFIISDSMIQKLKSGRYPMITESGFTQKYGYYYFLGAYLAKNKSKEISLIEEIVRKNYLKRNNFILLFMLHHTQDIGLIEDVVLHSMLTFENIKEATLDRKEAEILHGFIKELPEKIISEKETIDEKRKRERENLSRSNANAQEKNEDDYDDSIKGVNDIYKILKNNEVFGQILRNHYGNLDRRIIKDIIVAAIESGLRLIKIFLDEERLSEMIRLILARYPNEDVKEITKYCQSLCFLFTISNIERIVHSISVKGITNLIKEVIEEKSTPACNVIHYFSKLNTIDVFSDREKKHFLNLYKEDEKNLLIRKTLSLRTQHYFNTHTVSHDIKQSVCAKIGINYKPNSPQVSK